MANDIKNSNSFKPIKVKLITKLIELVIENSNNFF